MMSLNNNVEEDGRLTTTVFTDGDTKHGEPDFAPDLAALPDWIAIPLGEHILELEVQS